MWISDNMVLDLKWGGSREEEIGKTQSEVYAVVGCFWMCVWVCECVCITLM